MKVVVAPDSWKDCLPAVRVAEAMARGVRAAVPGAVVVSKPMADGGQGTVEAMVLATGGRVVTRNVTGPLGAPVAATFGVLGDNKTAVVEMAAAAGLELVPIDQRNPLETTTRGVGEMLLAAAESGVDRIVVGIGGSATNDGGAGLLAALGYRLLDGNREEIDATGGGLANLDRIEVGARNHRLDSLTIDVACDVTNPLLGPNGASAVYGPQKGADPATVEILERNLTRWAEILKRDLGKDVADVPGAGAAGGLGAGLLAATNARLKRGVELVIEAVGLREALKDADLCLTGEGSLDAQTAFGKTAVGVARECRAVRVPCFVIAGAVGESLEALHEEGVTAYFPAARRPATLEEAIREAPGWIADATEQAVRGFAAGRVFHDT